MNKPAKDFLRQRFQEWYADQVLQQLHGKEIDSVELEPISLSLPQLKELGAKWLVDMFKHIADNPQIIVNGFIKSGISAALDGMELQDDLDNGAGSGADDASSDDSEDEFED